MKKIFVALLLLFSFTFLAAQDNEVAKKLVDEGIQLHDKGDFLAAIQKYDEALVIDKNYYYAWYEKSYSLYMAKKLDECIGLSKYILQNFPNRSDNQSVYSNYGSALDDKGQSEKALEVYDEGIKKYPEYHLLHFNKGLTYSRLGRTEQALVAFQESLKLKPLHPSTNYYIGSLLQYSNKVPALMATLIFLSTEPEGPRADKAIERIRQIIYGNVKKDSSGSTTISINSDLLDKKNKKKDNDFSMQEMMMSFMFLPTNDKKLEAMDEGEKLSLQLQLLVNSLSEGRKDAKGFYWKFYVPFFIALKEKDYMSTFAHIAFTAKNDDAVTKWLHDNKDKVNDFYYWLQNYKWTYQ